MHRLRLCLFLLLAIAIPLQGYAYYAQPLVPCPMENTAMVALADAAAPDCCDDTESGSQSGKSCKPCQSGGLYFSASMSGVLPRMPNPATQFPHLATRAISFDPAATWRPPAQF